uniref:Venom-like beta-defensin n=1 Tax=Ornithorhynchus anatinus TaxID=9258 RepID=A0A6I8NPY1_ORNAN
MRLLILFLAVVTLLSLAGPGSAEVRRRRRRPPCEDVNGQCQPSSTVFCRLVFNNDCYIEEQQDCRK